MAENDEVVKPVRRALKLKPIKPIETSAAPAENTEAAPAPAAAPEIQ